MRACACVRACVRAYARACVCVLLLLFFSPSENLNLSPRPIVERSQAQNEYDIGIIETRRVSVTYCSHTHTTVSLQGSRLGQEQGGGAGPSAQKSREVELGCESWTSFASGCSSTAVQRTLSLRLCPSTAAETAIAQRTSRWAMARGHRLNTSVVLAAVHGLSGLFRAVSAVEPSLFRPLSPLSPSLISHLASVDVKQNGLSHVVLQSES